MRCLVKNHVIFLRNK